MNTKGRIGALSAWFLTLGMSAHATVTYEGTEGVRANIYVSGIRDSNTSTPNECIQCHTEMGTYSSAISPTNANHSIANSLTQMQSGAMPLSDGDVSSANISLFSQWISDLTPEHDDPDITSPSSSSIAKYSVTLNAVLFENGFDTNLYFTYWPTANSSNQTDSSADSPSGSGGGINGNAVSINISSLDCGTAYTYQAKTQANSQYAAENDNQTGSFTTDDCPAFTSSPVTSATEDVQYTYNITTNEGSATLTSTTDPDVTLVGSQLRWTPENLETSADIVLTLTDGTTPTTQSFTITVTPANDPPVISGSSTVALAATEDQQLSHTLVVTDIDGSDSFFYSLSGESGNMAVSGSGEFTWTPLEGETSTSVNVTVHDRDPNTSDPDELTDTVTLNITVTAENDPPVLDSVSSSNLNATEDTPFSLTITSSDVDAGDQPYYSLTGGSGDMAIDRNSGEITWTPLEAENTSTPTTTVSATVTVNDRSDNSGLSDSVNLDFILTPVNDAPLINTTAPTSALEANEYEYTVGVTDPDDTTAELNFSLSGEPSGMAIDTSGRITWTPPEDAGTVGPITVTVSDGGEDSASPATQMWSITVGDFNSPPSITSTAPTAATEDIEYSYSVQVSDVDDTNNGTDLTFTLLNEPTGMVVDTLGVITWTPTEDVFTSGTVTVTVADGGENGAAAATEDFTITVAAVADPPVIAGPDPLAVAAAEDQLTSFTVVATDDDVEDTLFYSLTGATGDMAIDSDGDFTWTPGEGELTPTVTIVVADQASGGLSDSLVVNITVTPENDPPVVQAVDPADLEATEDTPFSLQLVVSDSDAGDQQFYSLTGGSGDMAVSSTGEVTWTPLEAENGNSISATVSVSDRASGGNTVDVPLSFNLTAVNDAPQITSAASVSALEDNDYSYQVVVDDPDDPNNGSDLSFTLTNEPAGMSISTTGLISWLPPEGPGPTNEITLTVSDGGEDGSTPAEQRFTIIVGQFNSAPTINSTAPTAGTEDIEYQYQIDVTDLDDPNNGTDLQFALTDAPTGMTVGNTGLISWTPLEGVLTSGAVTVSVSDGGEDSAASAEETFTVTVTPVNDAPLISSAAPTAVIELNLYSYQVQVDDPDDQNDGAALSYSLTNAPTGMTISDTGLIEWTPDEGLRTSGEITLTVADGGEDAAPADEQVFTIEVTEFNTPPQIVSVPSNQAVEDEAYSYQLEIEDIDDPNDGSGALTFALENAPEGMTISNTGLIAWTPTEGVTGSGFVNVVVTDGGEDSAAPAEQDLTINVQAVNDQPIITSLAPTAIIDGEEYRYQVEVDDPDDSANGEDLSFVLASAPTGMTITSRGLIRWQTDSASPVSNDIVVHVSDGGEDGVQPAIQNFTLVVTVDIDSDGILNSVDNCPTTENADQADADGDLAGDACDDDDDNDGMSDEFEIANGLDPFDPADADQDSDGDGQSNLEESINNGNPNQDDIEPVLTLPNNILRFATGYETWVDIGQAVATDFMNGPLEVQSSRPSGFFRPGRHQVQWSAVDELGNTRSETQIVDVIPQIGVSAMQYAEEGQQVTVLVVLNGDPVRYPVSVDYSLSGTATDEDHNLSSGTLSLTSLEGEITFDLINDGAGEGEETLVLNFSNARNGVIAQAEHSVTIIEENIAPSVSLSAAQAGTPGLMISADGGQVAVSSDIDDPNVNETFTYDWSASDNRLVSIVGSDQNRFAFDPSSLQDDFYRLILTVTDSADNVTTSELVLEVTSAGQVDMNGNGLDDSVDMSESPFALQTDNNASFLETSPGLQLVMGESARAIESDGAAMSLEEFTEREVNAETTLSFVSSLYDFEIQGVAAGGQSVDIVLPLDAPLPADANYVKYTQENGWQAFVVNNNNSLSSAQATAGLCPGPGSDDYSPGLTEGHQCMQLNIEDGGPNDADGSVNGNIRDPGGIISGDVPDATSGGGRNSSGSGAVDLSFLVILFLLSLWRREYALLKRVK